MSSDLTTKLLEALSKIERKKSHEEECMLVQPHIEGQKTTNTLTIGDYTYENIYRELRRMFRSGLVSSGSYDYDSPLIGVLFSHLTPAGRKLLA